MIGDLAVAVGTTSLAVHDAAADLHDCVAGEGERGRHDSLHEGEFGGPAAALLDGMRGRWRERLSWGTATSGAIVSVAMAATAGGLAMERWEVLPALPVVPDGLHVRAATSVVATEHSKHLRRRVWPLGERPPIRPPARRSVVRTSHRQGGRAWLGYCNDGGVVAIMKVHLNPQLRQCLVK